MRIIHHPPFWPQAAHGSVMALGNFDGVHKGHQAVIGVAREIARRDNRPLAVMTFEPHPRRFFKPGLPVLRIVPFAEKARQLRQLGVDFLYVARFDRAFSQLSADAFVDDMLRKQLRVAHVVTGYDFSFGHQRAGNADYLTEKAQDGAFGYTRVVAVCDVQSGDAYSSTAIRRALEEGAVERASTLLGRPYSLRGPVIHGDKRGRTIGFPTANIRPAPLFLPRFGVYAVRLRLDGRCYPAVANLGVRPTIGGDKPMLEVHALEAEGDFYGAKAEVEFGAFLRPEQKFAGLEALKAQIAEDAAAARRFHANNKKKEHA